MNRFAILLGGDIEVTERLLQATSNCRVIAADSGMRHAKVLGLNPELWVGDFDSSAEELHCDWSNVEKLSYPIDKALTDGEIAVCEAIKRGAESIVLVGALAGERSDHALLHMLLAISLQERGIYTVLTSGTEEAYPLIESSLQLDLPTGSLFSVMGFTDLDGLDIANCRYPLENFSLAFGSSRTISNVANGSVLFKVEQGRAIILARPYDLTGK